MKRFRLYSLPLATSLALALAACGSGDSADAEGTAADDAATGEATEADAASAPEAAPAADASGPVRMISASCPGNIEFTADDSGTASINGSEASVAVSNENYYEATGGGVTISVAYDADGSAIVSYTGSGGANGICTVN